jgi:2-isopropylmalate synthase
MKKLLIFDTTLRDGEQSPGASLNVDEKLLIARQLDRLGVDIIEAGFPISSPGDFQGVQLVAEKVHRPIICGLARAKDADIDAAAEALKKAKRKRIHVFIATSKIHMDVKLRMSADEVLENAVRSVKRARQHTDDVEFSPEDASRTEIGFLCRILEAAIDAGATTVNIPDTVGCATPDQYAERIRAIRERVSNIDRAVISVHCHNDLGLAVANSLAAVKQGALQVECTINGIGERAGNASLEEIVMALKMHQGEFGIETSVSTREIWPTSRLVSDLTGLEVQRNKAIVGRNAFAHEAGIHQHGVIQARETYEIMHAEDVGWRGEHLVIGKHSGIHAVEKVLKERGYQLEKDDLREVIRRVKEVADHEKKIEEDDIVAIANDVVSDLTRDEQLMTLVEASVMTGNTFTASATLKVRAEDKDLIGTGTGVGPVDAAAHALRSILEQAIGPALKLKEYGLKAITGGTDALAHASICFEDEAGCQFRGDAIEEDVILASVVAMVKGANRALNFRKHSKQSKPEFARDKRPASKTGSA